MNDQFASSLLHFFKTIISPMILTQDPSILEIGSGEYSIFEETELEKKSIFALDLRIRTSRKAPSGISYIAGNIVESSELSENFYDLVFDSHCLHCLKSIEEQSDAIKNIYRVLKSDGIFASEIMVQPTKKKVFFPHRLVCEAREIEQMILNAGFKINYFVIVPQMNFYFDLDQGEIVCDMLRIIARK